MVQDPLSWLQYLEIPLLTVVFIAVSINLPYKPYWMITGISVAFLAMVWLYAELRYAVRIPLLVLFFVFLAVQVDALGNYFGLYKTLKEPFPYDDFAHFIIPLFSAPVIIWLFSTWIERYRYVLPLGVIAAFSVTVNFSLSGFYEIVELWDELFFGGKRIWTLHDTSNDLQWGLFGGAAGALITYAVLKLAGKTILTHREYRALRGTKASSKGT